MGSSAGRDIRQTFVYAEIPRLALGDAAVTSRVECLSHSDCVARNCALGTQQRGLLSCSPPLTNDDETFSGVASDRPTSGRPLLVGTPATSLAA
jgi:hypothetical protein